MHLSSTFGDQELSGAADSMSRSTSSVGTSAFRFVEASADVSLDLIVGVDPTDGFYIDTSGSDELSITNIVVTGELDGVGRSASSAWRSTRRR